MSSGEHGKKTRLPFVLCLAVLLAAFGYLYLCGPLETRPRPAANPDTGAMLQEQRRRIRVLRDKEAKLRQLDDLIAKHAADSDPHVKHAVMSMRIDRSLLLEGTEQNASLDDALRYLYGQADSHLVSPNVLQEVRFRLSAADSMEDRREKAAAYAKIAEDFGKSDNIHVRSAAASALLRLADLEDDEQTVVRHCRAVIGMLSPLPQGYEWTILDNAYMKLIPLIRDGNELLDLHDERIRTLGRVASESSVLRAMMDKAEILPTTERIAMYDEVVTQFGASKGWFESNSVADALMAKAECVESEDKKIALFDQAIARYEGAPSPFESLLGFRVVDAVAAKARALGDEMVLTSYIETVLARPGNRPGDIGLARELAKRMTDTPLAIKMYDSILKRYAGIGTPAAAQELMGVRAGRAAASGDRKEAERLRDMLQSPAERASLDMLLRRSPPASVDAK